MGMYLWSNAVYMIQPTLCVRTLALVQPISVCLSLTVYSATAWVMLTAHACKEALCAAQLAPLGSGHALADTASAAAVAAIW